MKLFYKIFFIIPNLLWLILSSGSEVSYKADDHEDTKEVSNCLVIIVGCASYRGLANLPECKKDIEMMKKVFEQEYGYKVISTYTPTSQSKECQLTVKDFLDFMRRIDDEAGKKIKEKILENEEKRERKIHYDNYREEEERLIKECEKKKEYFKGKYSNNQTMFEKECKNADNTYSNALKRNERLFNENVKEVLTRYKQDKEDLKNSKIADNKKIVIDKDKYDGVIFIFTGHGYLNTISLFEKEVYIKTIINFLARVFQDKPKIVMLFSCAGEKSGTYKGENDPNCIGQDKIDANQRHLKNFYIIRSCVDDYRSETVEKLGSVTVLHWKDVLLDNMPTKDQKIDLGRLKRVLQEVVTKKKITDGGVTNRVETVNVSMDTMLQRIFLIPKKGKTKETAHEGLSEEKSVPRETES